MTKENQSLLAEMVRTDFKLRYQGSVLGYLWSLLKPLMLFAVLYAVFTRVLRFGGDPKSLLLGIVLWNFFVEATSTSLTSIVDRGDLIRKIKLPKYLIVLSSTASALINLLLNLVVVFIFVALSGGNVSLWTIVFLPLVIIELYAVALSASFFLSAFYVKFRDISYIWEVVIQMMFFATPIIYPLSNSPAASIQLQDWIIKLMLANPIAQIIQDARSLITESGTLKAVDLTVSGVPLMVVPLGLLVISLFIGLFYFRSQSKDFAENI